MKNANEIILQMWRDAWREIIMICDDGKCDCEHA